MLPLYHWLFVTICHVSHSYRCSERYVYSLPYVYFIVFVIPYSGSQLQPETHCNWVSFTTPEDSVVKTKVALYVYWTVEEIIATEDLGE